MMIAATVCVCVFTNILTVHFAALPEVDPVISANGRNGPRKNICRRTIQELRHSIPMEQPRLSI